MFDLNTSTSPLVTYKFEDSLRTEVPNLALLGPAVGPRGGAPHNQAKNRAAKRARRISRLTRNGQHL